MTEIEDLIPHRVPFIFVDRLEQATAEEIVGYRTFRQEDFFFAGHFPGFPVVPGVILVEAMAQCGGAGVKASGLVKEGFFFLGSVDKVKFRRQVRPGDEVRMVIRNLRISPRTMKQAGQAFVGQELAAEAEWLCLVNPA